MTFHSTRALKKKPPAKKMSPLGAGAIPRDPGQNEFRQRDSASLCLIEPLESRIAPASFLVTTVADSGAGSLREALLSANGTPGLDTIAFAISGGGVETISPTSALPDIVEAVFINGFSQPGSSPNTNGAGLGENSVHLIVLDGFVAGAGVSGLVITGGGSTVRGLVIRHFGADGISIQGAGGNHIEGNFIGTNASGMLGQGNFGWGIEIADSPANTIGGTSAAQRNVISGNNLHGLQINGAGSTGNTVQGNFLGTNAAGTGAVGNTEGAVFISSGATGNLIGGTTSGARNLISGNFFDGVNVQGTSTTGNLVQGNYIGTNVAGTAALPNQGFGITLSAPLNTIGGTAAGAGNVISGNTDGILVFSFNGSDGSRNTIQGNFIGTNAAGSAALPNGNSGIVIDDTANNIGGTVAGARNVISGNGSVGIHISGAGATGNQVQGNYIGTDVTGTLAIGNAYGVLIGNQNNFVGGTAVGAGNLISGNRIDGIASSNGTTIQGNLIGTNASGLGALANGGAGISSFGSIIGGAAAGARNVISGNGNSGIVLGDGNQVQGNYIGTDITGTGALGNGGHGILLDGADNFIGGAAAGEGNVISGNLSNGIDVRNSSANRILGNRIGVNASGTAALGNAEDGVAISNGASGNFVGGAAAGEGNLISGNASDGIELRSGGNTVYGNWIGVNVTGTAALGNGDGIFIEAPGNTIGGASAGQGNLISGNLTDGIYIQNSSGTTIQGNRIGVNASGTTALANAESGIDLFNVSDILIGGTTAGEGNLLSGNLLRGIAIGNSMRITIQGNSIGTNAAGNALIGNGVEGILLLDNASANLIGGAVPGAGNVISGNGGDGVGVDGAGSGNRIAGNSIFNNGSLGIDLEDDGVTPNDAGDTDTGPNGLQNFPVLTSASFTEGNLTIAGILHSRPSRQYALEFFASTAADASGFGEGQIFLGQRLVTTDASGNFTFSFTDLPATAGFLTATATDVLAGATSEFSPVLAGPAPGPTLAINDVTVNEADGTATFTVTLSAASGVPVSVNYTTGDGTATVGADFTGVSGTLTFPAGVTTRTIAVPIAGETLFEPDETFFVNLSAPVGASLADGQGRGTIVNDDPVPTLSIANVTVAEGDSGTTAATFTVTLSHPSSQVVTVRYATADGTATAPGDFAAVALSMLTFAPGEVSQAIIIAVSGAADVEENETFFLELSAPANAALPNPRAQATIVNDDLVVTPMADGGSSVAVTDVDGDRVTVTSNRGLFNEDTFTFSSDGSLAMIDLRGDTRFTGSNLMIRAEQAGGGDGRVDLGTLNAAGVDLKNVTVQGALGRIMIGDGDPSRPALKKLTVDSLGTSAAVAQPLRSEVRGALGTLVVSGDVNQASFWVEGRIGSVSIGGSLLGKGGTGAPVVAALSGRGGLAALGLNAGVPEGIFGESIGGFTLEQNISNAAIAAAGTIDSVVVKGDVAAGAVIAAARIPVVKVLRNLASDDPANPVIIAVVARGAAHPAIDKLIVRGDVRNAQILLGYKSRIVDGPVPENEPTILPKNADASVGKIKIDGNWSASSLVAGVLDASGDGFGQNDTFFAGDRTPEIAARIASIVIKGTATGSVEEGDHFGISAQSIGKLSIGGESIALKKNQRDDVPLDKENGDFQLVEI